MLWKATTEWFGNLQNPKQYSRLMIRNRQMIPTFTSNRPYGTIRSEKIHREGEMVNGAMEKGDRGIQEQRKKSEGMVCGKRNKTQYTEILT